MGNLEPHDQELAMDPGRAPLRVFLAHPLNEITQATREGSSSMMNTTGCSSGVSVCVRDGLAGWGERIRTSAFPNQIR